MQKCNHYGALLLLLAAATSAHGKDTISVSEPWARSTAPGQAVGAVYLNIKSQRGAKLVKVDSPAAKSAEIHSMSMAGGVMKMQAVDALELPADKPVSLAPGGYHVMLIDLKQPLKVGGKVSLKLTTLDADKRATVTEVSAPIKATTGGHAH